MWHAEFNLITTAPARLGPAVVFIEAKVRPEIEGRAGSLGISICTNPEVGMAITKNNGLPGREQAVRRAGGGLCGAGLPGLVFELEAANPGVTFWITRMDIGIAEGVHAYGDDALPRLADTQGFRGALLLVDGVTGHVVIEAIWRLPRRRTARPGRVGRLGDTGPPRSPAWSSTRAGRPEVPT
jgi:hypothetical protein